MRACKMGVLKWLRIPERRPSATLFLAGVVAYYWNGGPALPHKVRELSVHGAVVRTSEEWYPGTLIQMVLQRVQNGHPLDGKFFFELWGRVIRHAGDECCLEFVFQDWKERLRFRHFLAKAGGRSN